MYNGENLNGFNQNYNNGDQYSNPNNKNKKNRGIIIAIVICVILLFGSLITAGIILTNNIDLSEPARVEDSTTAADEEKTNTTEKYDDIGKTAISEVATSNGSVTVTDVSGVVEGTMPSVVAITSKTLIESNYSMDIYDYYFGGGGESGTYEQEAAGSGIIVDQTDSELLIVTNNHVVEGADSLKIQFDGMDAENAVDGYIKGTDAGVDIAVVAVKLSDIPQETLKSVKKASLGDSDTIKVGEGVVAIGNALGYGQSVTTGVISAKDREVTVDNNTMILLQTDAAINGGNSGGALINAKGEVIGINVAKYSSSGYDGNASIEGMGFAIPISSVKNIISELEKKESRQKVAEKDRGYLGISGQDVKEEDSIKYSIPAGVYVVDVTKDGPADKAGIAASDVITKFDGQAITSMSTLQGVLEYYKAGEKVEVTISYRDGREYKEKTVKITLGDSSVLSK